jgi:diguanylate cyclase (GGDEF)-like protein/PAS domain S-box-containing protein
VTKDLRGIPVIAAYTPIAATGLGLVVKANADAAYAPMRDRLNILGSLLIGLVAAGWWALRSQVRPLVAQLAAAQREVAHSEKHLRDIADNLPVLIGYISSERKLMFANRTFEQWIGLDPDQLKGKPLTALGTSIYEDRADMLAASLAGKRVEYECVSDALGVVRILHTVLVPDSQADGQVVGVYALSTDVSANKAAEQHLQQLARIDALTGLPNRRQFEERLKQAMARSSRTNRPMALIFMDIDHFKAINDSLGHGAGDEVLKEFSVRMQGTIRLTDLAARLAGDEFVVILEGLNTAQEASIVAAKLVEAIRRPMRLVGQPLPLDVTASMGLAYYEGREASAGVLIERADRALYRAKAAGRNTFATTVI